MNITSGSASSLFESRSPAMVSMIRMLPSIAAHDAPVLLRGESGVGKSVLARALHDASPRRAFRLVTVDCRALAANFPPEAGALAHKLDEAAAGTLLLDEVGALPDRGQLAIGLLIDESRVPWMAPHRPRIVATSSRDLEAEVRAGRLRMDLLSRLSVVEIQVPPLRERREDILPFASRFAEEFARNAGQTPPELTLRAQRALLSYRWPGNVRELRNAVQRAMIVGEGSVLDLEALPPKVAAAVPAD